MNIYKLRLIPIRFDHRNKGHQYWLYKCSCPAGTEKIIRKIDVDVGRILSCGCLHREITTQIGKNNKIHGETTNKKVTTEFLCWRNIRLRCFNENNKSYPDYGGRGITMYEPWRNDYQAFLDYLLSTIGRRPSKNYSLDRIDNDGNYEPGNIRWATRNQQNKHKTKPHEREIKQLKIRIQELEEQLKSCSCNK